MPRTAAEAREELRQLLDRGVDLDFMTQGPLANLPSRRSAVLILFGALDRVPAIAADMPVPPELDVLLMRRANTLRHHAGQISFPGGGVEPQDDGPVATALREANEETGLDPAGVEVLGMLPEVHVAVSNNVVTPVVGWWTKPTAVEADESESVEVFRTPIAEMLNPAARGTSVITRGGSTFRGKAFVLRQGHVVWGLTGILLANIYEQVGWELPWDKSREIPVSA
ncbi:NUDIX hydrolase [Leucobacter denitrificans]|uniref:CoA pyrophosphatase n=1 Tax=Leucobacter denitrificans TaxID=683042 RepID=A0A7G9S1Y4_9MICO|nr:CoA pyrophosphatase [Leucobacter denitrificans]QNN61859.1 CoA pyrophosphatase [Leucobacter denitrificans]